MGYTSPMKLSQYAQQLGISYRTALRWFRAGTIQGYQAPPGTVIVTEGKTRKPLEKVALDARISSADTARLSGQRRAKRKTERIGADLEAKEDEDATR
jgi:predicted site-specific integrase-resolvase